jgi:hypothetical protein
MLPWASTGVTRVQGDLEQPRPWLWGRPAREEKQGSDL